LVFCASAFQTAGDGRRIVASPCCQLCPWYTGNLQADPVNDLCFRCGLAPAGNKEPCGCSLTPPPPQWDGEENQKEKAKLVCWDKNSLTEWQREKKITIMLYII